VQVHFYGSTEYIYQRDGSFHVLWRPGMTVRGEPYHTLVPGYGVGAVNILRLWRARASEEFNFHLFDTGDYAEAVAEKVLSENITKVLYPNDNTPQGRELRLKQQYFLVACSLQDIIRRFYLRNQEVIRLHEQVAIQLNDTHPVIAIPELMRLLLDQYRLGWDEAWAITTRTFAYTCHTLLPEALERWPISLLEYLLPRHLEIIYEINRRFIEEVRGKFPGDQEMVRRISIIDNDGDRFVRMAHLACVGSHAINGVAELHTRLLKDQTLRDFAAMWPERFQNVTNGVTPRRFVRLANPGLSRLISSLIGDGWVKDLEQLRRLEDHLEDAGFRQAWREVKQHNKLELAEFLSRTTGLEADPGAIFDVMVKRLHEYKRQLLKVLHIITLYQRIKQEPAASVTPRLFLFGAKAAPGYHRAKLIIKLINSVADVVNNDPVVAGRLLVAFPANFNVTMAERTYPAADISEQISLAGMEASGTGNMKFALNGALTVGTLDGANIEIRERVGAENFFRFGLSVEEVNELRRRGYSPQGYYEQDADLQKVLDSIAGGEFSFGNKELFRPIVDELLFRDPFMLLADYAGYISCQDQASLAYLDTEKWTRMSILNCARCGYFSSDRSVREYAQKIWGVSPVRVDMEVD
jgi:starch phosphorylase